MSLKPISLCVFSYKKSYYLTHPFLFIKELWIGARNAWHRMRYGFAWIDLWNMDTYLGKLVPSMLRELAVRSCGTPYDIKEEEYKAYLTALARLFELTGIYEFCEDYEGARTSLLELHDEKFSSVERLYARAKAAIEDDPKHWTVPLIQFCYTELGALAARGWLWD